MLQIHNVQEKALGRKLYCRPQHPESTEDVYVPGHYSNGTAEMRRGEIVQPCVSVTRKYTAGIKKRGEIGG